MRGKLVKCIQQKTEQLTTEKEVFKLKATVNNTDPGNCRAGEMS